MYSQAVGYGPTYPTSAWRSRFVAKLNVLVKLVAMALALFPVLAPELITHPAKRPARAGAQR